MVLCLLCQLPGTSAAAQIVGQWRCSGYLLIFCSSTKESLKSSWIIFFFFPPSALVGAVVSHFVDLLPWRSTRLFLGLRLPLLLLNDSLPVLPATLTETVANGEELSEFAHSQILKTPFLYCFPDSRNPANLLPLRLYNGIPLEEAVVESLQSAVHLGRLTSSQISFCYMQRIYQTDSYVEYVFVAPIGQNSYRTLFIH